MKIKSMFLALLLCFILPQSVLAIEEMKPKQETNLEANITIDRNIVARKYLLGPNDVISIYVPEAEEYNAEKLLIQPDYEPNFSPSAIKRSI